MPWTRPCSIRFSRPVAEPVDAGVLRHVADRAPHGVRLACERRGRRPSAAPSSGVRQRHEHAHGRRLAGAVRAEQPEDLAFADGERDAVERLHLAVALAQLVDDDRVHRRRGLAASPARVRAPMDLYEYQGKQLFKRFGIPVSEGRLATTPGGGARGGRGARRPGRRQGAGADRRPRQGRRRQARRGSRRTPSRRRATSSGSTSAATSSRSSGSSRPPTSRRSTTSRSRSTAARRSRSSCSRRRAASRSRRSPRTNPDALVRLHVDPLEGFQPWVARRLVYGAGVEDPSEQKQIAAIVEKLYRCFVESDAMLCEINPLIVTPDGEVKALDSKFTVDDSALYRHPDIAELRDTSAADPLEAFAREKGVTYVKLDGSVGHPRQRRRALDVDRRRRRRRRRQARELLRPRRRRQRARASSTRSR